MFDGCLSLGTEPSKSGTGPTCTVFWGPLVSWGTFYWNWIGSFPVKFKGAGPVAKKLLSN